MGISKLVKQRREAANLSQSELSRRTGGAVTQAKISRLESGEENITVQTLRELARGLGCAPVDLLPDEFKRPPEQKAA